ncbi:MAG: IS110 family transposase [Candidatus Thermoplasmatota archaeon]|nr:IS110 family transposase [Candidatus Thermoplasmatota archaeon]
MKYIGVDLHQNFSQIFLHDKETEETIERRIPNEFDAISSFFTQFDGDCKVAIEATRNWYWLVDLLQSMGTDVILSNPVQTKAIAYARVKNDKVDARMLSQLLENDLLAEAWIPSPEQRRVREMLRMRLRLVKIRTMAKNVIRSSLAKLNVRTEHQDIWRGRGREELESVTLEEPYDMIIDQLLEIIDLATDFIMRWERKVKERVKKDKEAMDNCRLLETHPGIGDISAFTILYESGPISRFSFLDDYIPYVGLSPKTRGSADKYRTGHLSKQANMYLKWIYVEIATHIIRMGKGPLWLYYQKKRWHRGKPVAKIALAREIATDVYFMLRDNIDYATFLKRGKERRAGHASEKANL